jgi:hypothetical protein
MFALGLYTDAGSAFALTEYLSGPTDRVVRRGKEKLAHHGIEMPRAAGDLFPDVVSAAFAAFRDHLSELQVETTGAAHLAQVRRAVYLLSTEMPGHRWPTVS